MDKFFEMLIDISKPAQHLLNHLRNINIHLNIVTIGDYDEMTKNEKRNFYRNLKPLKELDLVRKVTKFEMLDKDLINIIYEFDKHTYMVNPHMIKPINDKLAFQIWDLLPSHVKKE